MALTLRRLWPAALVLAAILLALEGPRGAPPPSPAEQQVARLYQVRLRLNEAGGRWAALAERDSAVMAVAKSAHQGQPDITLRGFGAARPAPELQKRVSDLWTWLGPADSTVRVGLVVYNGDAYRFNQSMWWAYSGSTISLEQGGATCIAILHGEKLKDGTVDAYRDRVESALAPCILLAGFGVPGPAILRWLSNTRYASAGSTAWLNRSRSFIDGGRGVAPPWMAYYDWGSEQGVFASDLVLQVVQALRPPYELGAHGVRCTAGDLASCRAGILDSTVVAKGMTGLPADLTFSQALLDRPLHWTLATPRPPGEWWLSDLIRDQGREKFARFWKSSAPFEQAFQAAFGEDLGAWTHRWSVRQWENSWVEKYRGSPLVLGATLQPAWPFLALGWTGLLLMLTAWVARRRQVT